MTAYQQRACSDRGLPLDCTEHDQAAADAGVAGVGAFSLFINGANFLGIAAVGELSDALGRKPALIVVLGGGLATSALWLTVWHRLSISALVAAQAVPALTGGQFAVYGVLTSVLADLTASFSVARRAAYFGVLMSTLFLGLVIGPLLISAVETASSSLSPRSALPRLLGKARGQGVG